MQILFIALLLIFSASQLYTNNSNARALNTIEEELKRDRMLERQIDNESLELRKRDKELRGRREEIRVYEKMQEEKQLEEQQ